MDQSKKITKYFEMNKNKQTTHTNLGDAAKAARRRNTVNNFVTIV